ncbi:MAG: SUMF1/EgtB/PvdO family nonheme iron enzyme [Flavobacteriaceae bacterium]|nr:SUMF1/EgtB/PvdO family nonheme iron enzyme [Flavobacteriaceae bacterium]
MKHFATSLIMLVVLSPSFTSYGSDKRNFVVKAESQREPAKRQCREGLVFIEGGDNFIKGLVNDDVFSGWNQRPTEQIVKSFFMDETEVTNATYLEYVGWLKGAFPNLNSLNKSIHESALPDSSMWKTPLGYFEESTQFYFGSPAYAEWRTDWANEAILINNHQQDFNTSVFLKAPETLFEQESEALLAPFSDVNVDNPINLMTSFRSGLEKPKYRLPRGPEWEYAAKIGQNGHFPLNFKTTSTNASIITNVKSFLLMI